MAWLNRGHIGRPDIHHLVDNGTSNFIGDYTSAPKVAKYTPSKDYLLTHLSVVLEDLGTFDTGDYGNKLALINGVRIVLLDEDGVTELHDLLDGDVILGNGDWAHYAEKFQHVTMGTGNEILAMHFEFYSQWGQPYFVAAGQSLAILLEDDFTGLVRHEFHAVGIHVRNGGLEIGP